MKKKILIGSIIAVVILTLVSFSSVVGYNSLKSDLDISLEENAISIEFGFQRIKELIQSINLQKIIVNPDAVLETIEEISSILEEDDVRNYIEKSSEEDCGCEKPKEWGFPIICATLLVMVGAVFIIVMIIFLFSLPPPNSIIFILSALLSPIAQLYEKFNCPEIG